MKTRFSENNATKNANEIAHFRKTLAMVGKFENVHVNFV